MHIACVSGAEGGPSPELVHSRDLEKTGSFGGDGDDDDDNNNIWGGILCRQATVASPLLVAGRMQHTGPHVPN